MKTIPALLFFLLVAGLVGIGSASTNLTINVSYDALLDRTTNGTWSEHRDGYGEQVSTNQTNLYGGYHLTNSTSGIYDTTRITGMSWDTSSVPDNATINSATVSVWGNSYAHTLEGHTGFTIIDWTPANVSVPAAGDYNKTTYTRLSNVITGGTYLTNITNYTLNTDGLAAINKTGYTSLLFVSNNTASNTSFTWSNTTSYQWRFKGRNNVDNIPALTINYDLPAAAAPSFSTNVSADNNAPICAVLFTDTSTLTGITNRSWMYYDYGTLPHRAGEPTLHYFSTNNDSAPVYSFGAGNFSIRLIVTVTNGTQYTTTDKTSWVNVSAGRSLGYAMSFENDTAASSNPISGTFRMYPDNAIWNVPTNTLPKDTTNSDNWISALTVSNTEAGLGARLYQGLRYSSGAGSAPYYLINDSITAQQSIYTPVYTYLERGVALPIPDDMITWEEWDTRDVVDHEAFLIDIDNETMYRVRSAKRQANGTWYVGGATIWNFSEYGYRFTPGSTWLGNNYTTTVYGATPQTLRGNYTASSGGGVSDIPKFPGYVRYEEVATGQVNHSMYIAVKLLNGTAIWPAMGNDNNAIAWADAAHTKKMPDKGAWIRLKSSYDINGHGLGTQAKVIAQALQTYGGYLTSSSSFFRVPTCVIYRALSPAWNILRASSSEILTYELARYP